MPDLPVDESTVSRELDASNAADLYVAECGSIGYLEAAALQGPDTPAAVQQLGKAAVGRVYKTRWTYEQLLHILTTEDPTSISQIVRGLDMIPGGGNSKRIKKAIEDLGFVVEQYCNVKKPLEELCRDYTDQPEDAPQSNWLKMRLIRSGWKAAMCECNGCGWSERSSDGRLLLELHHVDGNPLNNLLSNLKIYCPCCHSRQLNHCKKLKSNAGIEGVGDQISAG